MGSLPHLASDGLDLTVYSIHRVIMVCSLLQELFIFSCDPSGKVLFSHLQHVATSRIQFLVEGEPAVIEDQSCFHFLSPRLKDDEL